MSDGTSRTFGLSERISAERGLHPDDSAQSRWNPDAAPSVGTFQYIDPLLKSKCKIYNL